MFTENNQAMKSLLSLFIVFLSFQVLSNDLPLCLESAQTQSEMNRCEGINLQSTRAELCRVLTAIKVAYKSTSPEFLLKLEISQKAWEETLKADMDMKYPQEDKRGQYGSVYPMCASGFESMLILSRIEFLKEWLQGHKGGVVCSGSVIHSYCIENDCSKIGK